jgi:aspartate racemase
MKTIGLIGGMSWESTASYYRFINEAVRERRGGLHSAKCILYSVDFAEVEALQRRRAWPEATRLLIDVARGVEAAGADFVLICTNTMHKLADAIQAALRIPLLHIADATGERVRQAGLRRVGLLGTRFTMEEGFFRDRLARQFGLDCLVPGTEDRDTVHRIIYEELCVGRQSAESRAHLGRIIDQLVQAGAQGIILGCTELGLLISDQEGSLPVFDTTRIHALAAVAAAL